MAASAAPKQEAANKLVRRPRPNQFAGMAMLGRARGQLGRPPSGPQLCGPRACKLLRQARLGRPRNEQPLGHLSRPAHRAEREPIDQMET